MVKNSHYVLDVNLHIVLVTKRRRPVITEKMMSDVITAIRGLEEERHFKLIECNYAPESKDHVHILLELTSLYVNIYELVHAIKLQTRDLITNTDGTYCGWTIGEYVEAVSGAKLNNVREYIEHQ